MAGGGPSGTLDEESVPSAGSVRETQEMSEAEPGHGDPLAPLDWLKILPVGAVAASNRRGWSGLEAARYRAAPASELHPPAMTHHRLVLFGRPSEELDPVYEGVKRHVPRWRCRWCAGFY